MTTTKAANLWPTQGVDGGLVYNNQPNNADVIRTLAGNAATIIGYANGGAFLDEYTANPAPLCPGHGRPGHDHSGGVFGYPLRRTVAHIDLGLGYDGDSSTNIDGNDQHPYPFFRHLGIAASSASDWPSADPVMPIWVPSGDRGPTGAYPLMGVVVTGQITTATNMQTSDSLTITVVNKTTGASIDLVDSSITATGLFRCASTGTDDLLFFDVGRINTLVITRYRLTTTATVASRSLEGYVSSVEVGVWLS